MPTELIVIVIVVVVATIIAISALRRRPTELPPQEKKPELRPGEERPAEATPKARADWEAEAARPEAAEAEAKPAAPAAEAEAPAAKAAGEAEARAVEPVAPEAPVAPTEEEIAVLKKGLASTRGGFISRLAKVFGGKKEIDPDLLDEIEEVLITADIGVGTSQKILAQLRERMGRKELGDEDKVWEAIREEARAILADSGGGVVLGKKPTVILVVGVNGVGKTTTIGKLASRLTEEGKRVVLAAGDTFRAAAVLQLEVWGRRVGCPVVKGKDRADPASVVFDAIKRGEEEGADVVIADTAGRLHTKTNLMEELKKVARTCDKALGRPADEILLVLDSTNGQNAIQQAQMFKEALAVTGIVLTKLDGTAKGGVILGIVDEHGLPVRYIGIGERVEDLREFEVTSFVEALFSKPDDESMAA